MTLDDLPSGHIVLSSWARTQDAKERRLCGSLGLCVFDEHERCETKADEWEGPVLRAAATNTKGGL